MVNVINGLKDSEANYQAVYNFIKEKNTRSQQKTALTKEINQIKDELGWILNKNVVYDKEGKTDFSKYISEHFAKHYEKYYMGYKYTGRDILKVFQNIERLTKVRKNLNNDKMTTLEAFTKEQQFFWGNLDNSDAPQIWREI